MLTKQLNKKDYITAAINGELDIRQMADVVLEEMQLNERQREIVTNVSTWAGTISDKQISLVHNLFWDLCGCK